MFDRKPFTHSKADGEPHECFALINHRMSRFTILTLSCIGADMGGKTELGMQEYLTM